MKTRYLEQPIIFTDIMIRAILTGRKTQTRQAVTPFIPEGWIIYRKYQAKDNRVYWTNNTYRKDELRTIYRLCTLGRPRNRLWLRETFAVSLADEVTPRNPHVIYGGGRRVEGYTRWQPPRLMHRDHSRTILEIIRVRAEKLQDISEIDAQAEGVPKDKKNGLYRSSFCTLWDELNAGHAATWASNPWVWVIEFKRIQ